MSLHAQFSEWDNILDSWYIATRSAWIDFSSLKDYRNIFGILCCIGSSPSVYKQSLNYWLHK